MDDALVSETLDALSDAQTARKTARNVSTLRGIRGTPHSEIARVGAAFWKEHRPTLSDEDALDRLFARAWEDGLLAVGLLAALVPDGPAEALDIGVDWLGRVDDTATADALGWLVLGPAFLATGADPDRLHRFLDTYRCEHFAPRRALVSMGMAFLPLPIEGCAAAPLRERHGARSLSFVDRPRSVLVEQIARAFLRDPHPSVLKALRRLLKGWAKTDPDAVAAWTVPGGLPKLLAAACRPRRPAGRR